tara:strand:+ start:4346 stop:5197 length:852 start_codon:yes stop_codon:yes gene_type:complete
MNKGYLVIAQNSKHDYVRMSYALALSIAITQKKVRKLSIAVDKDTVVPDKYKTVFDQVIQIPFEDDAELSEWKINNKWKYYHITPYDHTVILDCDMLFTRDVGHWWDYFLQRDITACCNIKTFRNELADNSSYRQTFIHNQLPDVYTAFFHFNKNSDAVYEYFKLVEHIFRNYDTFKEDFLVPPRQSHLSADVVYALAGKILGIGDDICNKNLSYPTFVHMKTQTQGFNKQYSEDWTKHISSYYSKDCELMIGNYKQDLPFHYRDKNFLTDEIIVKLEKKLGV